MATALLTQAPAAPLTAPASLASLDDLLDHPLCTVIETGEEVEEGASRFRFEDAAGWQHGEDVCDDSFVLHVGQLFVNAGRPFTLTISEPFDQEAADIEEAEYRADIAQLWAAHGPGR